MVLVNYSGKEINAKVVYYGPGLCGKTTNLEYIYSRVPQNNRGKMVSMKTRTERTLFFDFLPLNLGNLAGFQTRFLLYTVPGQVYYNATRKLVLKGVDALIFVADSGRGKMDENIESLENLNTNLREHGLDVNAVPLVLQYNKRDLPEVYSIDELQQALNPENRLPWFEATATNGHGVFETFKGVARLLLAHLSKSMGMPEQKTASGRSPISEAMDRPEFQSGARPVPGAGSAPPPGPPSAAMQRPAGVPARPASGAHQAPGAPSPGLELQAQGPGAAAGGPVPPPQPAPRAGSPHLPQQPPPSSGSMPALMQGSGTAEAHLSIVHGEQAANDRRAAPAVHEGGDGAQRLLRVPVYVSQADIDAGVTIELVLRVDRSAESDDALRQHFG